MPPFRVAFASCRGSQTRRLRSATGYSVTAPMVKPLTRWRKNAMAGITGGTPYSRPPRPRRPGFRAPIPWGGTRSGSPRRTAVMKRSYELMGCPGYSLTAPMVKPLTR
jgi:hypothetical protein